MLSQNAQSFSFLERIYSGPHYAWVHDVKRPQTINREFLDRLNLVVRIELAIDLLKELVAGCVRFVVTHTGLTFDMSGGPKGAKRPLERPLDGRVGLARVEGKNRHSRA